jgi:hypothetical protein
MIKNTLVNSGDGNSIFDIAKQYQNMQIREMGKNPAEILKRILSGADTGSTKFIDDFGKV